MKRCPACYKVKEDSEFYKDRHKPSGLRSRCKDCEKSMANKRNKKYYNANREKLIEKSKEYYQNNKEARKKYYRDFYKDNREKELERGKKNYQRKKEKQ